MGRGADARRAARRHRAAGSGPASPPPAPVRELLVGAARRLRDGDVVDDVVAALVLSESLAGGPAGEPATRAASSLLMQVLDPLWHGGWQPADLLHVVGSQLTRRIARLAETVVVTEADRSGAVSRAPAPWRDQLLAMTAAVPPRRDVVAYWRALGAVSATDAWRDVVRLLALLTGLVPVTALGPTPAQWGQPVRPPDAPSGSTEPPMLSRVRALLAKAESTTFPAEAEALTAKAQELMTRHALDLAVVEQAPTHRLVHQVQSRRVHLDEPYVEAKAGLLDGVGRVNDVRVVLHTGYAMATAVGLPLDLDLVELLFTSLLVQATRELTDLAGVQRRARGAAFRRGFLSAYGVRVTERLAQARLGAEAARREAHGAALVPVLAARREAVAEAFGALFPELSRTRLRSVDSAGWSAGTAAAERADLGAAMRDRRLAP